MRGPLSSSFQIQLVLGLGMSHLWMRSVCCQAPSTKFLIIACWIKGFTNDFRSSPAPPPENSFPLSENSHHYNLVQMDKPILPNNCLKLDIDYYGPMPQMYLPWENISSGMHNNFLYTRLILSERVNNMIIIIILLFSKGQ